MTVSGFDPVDLPQYRQFERMARRVMSAKYGVPLVERELPGVRKKFDMVSADGSIVGDAKCLTMVGGTRLPPAKFSVIAEHVWLLEKTSAAIKFLVFGNDEQVPRRWLEKYGGLVDGVTFYFLPSDGVLSCLRQPE